MEALRTRADALLDTVSDLERRAEERARAEGLNELERRAVVVKADVDQRRAALAECPHGPGAEKKQPARISSSHSSWSTMGVVKRKKANTGLFAGGGEILH